jgi:hypothetical protein
VIHGKDQGSRLAELLDDPSIIRPSSIMGKFLMNAAKSPHSMKGYQVFSPSDFRN